VNEEEVRARVHEALGEPPAAAAVVQRLEASLHLAPAQAVRERRAAGHPRGMGLLAAALAVLVLGGLLAVRAAQLYRLAQTPGGGQQTTGTPAASGSCMRGAPAKLIVVHLATQELIAYENGCPFLTTAVTTGRPALATPTGTFRVRRKALAMELVSPWPKGSPNWYPAVTVHDYLALTDSGLALHSAEWEPADAWGAGSQNGPYGTHGDVNVQSRPLRHLYEWATVGTTVIIDDSPGVH
jgi:lipoprotein-anchoring transpeptidase ErfK/SrfK